MASTILTLALAPTRLAPAATMVCKSSRVRTPHQRHIRGNGAARAKARGGLDEIGTGFFREQRPGDFLFVVEQRILENHFDDRSAGMRRLDHRFDIGAHCVVIAAAQLANIQYHVDLLGSVANGRGGFGNLDLRGACAQREPDHRAHLHGRPCQLARDQTNPIWIHANAREAVIARLSAHLANVGRGGFRFQQSVIDQHGDRGIEFRHRTDRSIGVFRALSLY